MYTIQNALDNFKRDIDTLKHMGDDLVSIDYKCYQDYLNDKRENHYKHYMIIRDRASVIHRMLTYVNTHKVYRTVGNFELIVDKYASIIKDYNGFILSLDLDESVRDKVKISIQLKNHILGLGKDIDRVVFRLIDCKYAAFKIENLLKLL